MSRQRREQEKQPTDRADRKTVKNQSLNRQKTSPNRDGLLTEARNPNSQVKIVRDKQGRIKEEWQDGHKVESRYDESGRRIKVTDSLGADLDMGYTEAGLLRDMRSTGWEMHLKHNERGLEIERVLPGGVVSRNDYDEAGRVSLHSVTSRGSEMRRMRYRWSLNDRLINTVNELTRKDTWFDYDTMGNLTGSTYNNTEKLFRVPDAVGNLYKTKERSDRKYGAGGRLLETEDTKYHYDEEGNLAAKVTKNKVWRYLWNTNGSLKEVVRPDLESVKFEYDALGRRTAKIFNNKITRWVWDGNTPLHEWSYPLKDRPKTVKDEFGFESKDREEPVENLITWVFEEGTFKPTAKLTENGNYSIITDYLGTPAQMYDDRGNLTWETKLDIYGKVRNFAGSSLSDCPFRYQGQYFDDETGLAYNRFRYYSPDEGIYLSQDPIGLEGNKTLLYSYVDNPTISVDSLGLISGWIARDVWSKLDKTVRKKFSEAIKKGIVPPTGNQGIIRLLSTEPLVKEGYTHKLKILGKGGDIRIYGKEQPNGHIIFDKIQCH